MKQKYTSGSAVASFVFSELFHAHTEGKNSWRKKRWTAGALWV
jgi:hypothetical protein